MNDESVLARLVDANAYREDAPLPESIWGRDDAFAEIELRAGLRRQVARDRHTVSADDRVGRPVAQGRTARPERTVGWRRRALVAVAAFAAVLVVGTIASTLDLVNDGQAVGAQDALIAVEEYFTAFENGDFEALTDVLSPNEPTQFVRVCENSCTYFDTWSYDYHQRYSAYKMAEGTALLDRSCALTDSTNTEAVVTCEYDEHEYVARAVGAPASPTVATITVTRHGIGAIELAYEGEAPADAAQSQFKSWMSRWHPDQWGSVGRSTWTSLEDATTKGQLTAQYGDAWATYLDEAGCTYLDGC